MPELVLTVNGKRYGGWKEATVTRGIEAVAGGFDLQVSERWAGQDQPWPIQEEDACALALEGQKVISGYVEKRAITFDAQQHQFAVSGRDKTGDLVDSSAVLSDYEFHNQDALSIAKAVAAPFGIAVTQQAGLALPPPPVLQSVNPGDTAYEVIERACRQAGLLPVSDGQGGLLLTRAGSQRAVTALVQGGNILEAKADFDATGRFRTYLVTAQAPGTDENWGAKTADIEGRATDPAVRRAARVLLIRSETNGTPEYSEQRAAWEAAVRAGRAATFQVTVQGWTQEDGSLWPVNALVPLRSDFLGMDGDVLITQATYTLSDRSGTRTTLSLKRADAFRPEPVVPEFPGGLWNLTGAP